MNLNLYVIRDLLPDYAECNIVFEYIQDDLLAATFKAVTFMSLNNTSTQYLYLLDADTWCCQANNLTQGSYIVLNWDKRCPCPTNCSCLGITTSHSIMTIFSNLHEIFLRLHEWECELYDMVARNAPLKEMGDISLSFLTNPICLYTTGHQNIFFSEQQKPKKLMLFTNEDLHAFLTYEEVEGLRFNPDFVHTIEQTVPSIFPDEFWGYRILYDNIRANGVYIARLMVCEVERPFREGDHLLLRHLAEIMKYSIERQNWTINGHPKYVDDHIATLIRGESLSKKQLKYAFEVMDWNYEDDFFCLLIPLSSEDRQINTVTTVCSKLEATIPGTISVLLNDVIFMLSNITQSGSDRDTIITTVIYILREHVLHAGISMQFRGLTELNHYYSQADYALKYGEKTDSNTWYYRYEHYEYHHLLENALGDASLESIYPIGLKRLLAYDKEHNRQYTYALKTYLEQNMSITNTIRKLYIQKSTFVYQLKRIREISDINLDSKEVRILYLLIFQIMEEKGCLQQL